MRRDHHGPLVPTQLMMDGAPSGREGSRCQGLHASLTTMVRGCLPGEETDALGHLGTREKPHSRERQRRAPRAWASHSTARVPSPFLLVPFPSSDGDLSTRRKADLSAACKVVGLFAIRPPRAAFLCMWDCTPECEDSIHVCSPRAVSSVNAGARLSQPHWPPGPGNSLLSN